MSVFIVVAAFLLLAAHEDWWERIGVFHLRPYYADTYAILAAGDAERAGRDIYQYNPLDPLGRPHVYGEWWLWAGRAGLTRADAWWLGALIGLGFVATVVGLVGPRNPAEAGFSVLLLLSPPVLLGIERGNNDLVVFMLLALATLLLRARSRMGGVLGAAVLAFAAVLKIYPLAALTALLGRRERPGRVVWLIVGALVLFVSLWWLQRETFFRALAISPRPDTLYAYGVRVVWLSGVQNGGVLTWWLGGLLFGALAVWMLLRRGAARLVDLLPEAGHASLACVVGGAVWLFCYVANTNFSYRAALLLLTAPMWIEAARSNEEWRRMLGQGLGRLLLMVVWFFMVKYFVIEFWRESGEARAFWRWPMLVAGVEQALMLGYSAALAAALAGWVWRRARVLLVCE